MENKWIFFIVIYSLFFIHCSTSRSEKRADSGRLELVQVKQDMSYKSNPDSIHLFTCNNKKYRLRAKKISRAYFPDDLRECLLDRGFNGDEEANRQLASIIENSTYNNLLIFRGIDAEYRGPAIFEAFLKKSQDYTPLNLEDDGEDSKTRDGTVADVYIGYYLKMVESIDGYSPEEYIGVMVDFQNLDNYLYGEDGLFNPAYGIEVGTKIYNAISKAWEEGKIILKAYGEK